MTVAPHDMPLLDVRDLKIEFDTPDGVVHAASGVSFDLNRGEIVALVGESGCGKSVTAMAILRLISDPPGRITGGEVHFEGRDLLRLPLEAIQRIRGDRIAMVFQEPMNSLNPVHTIGDQVIEPLTLHKGVNKRQGLARVLDLLRSVRIPDPQRRYGSYPHQFSGGMRQRVMIAMSMGCVPDIVIADEPTTALDVTIQAQLLELLQEQVTDRHTAMLLITHNLGIVARYADRVNVMYAGRIVESANADDIFERPRHPYTIGLLQSVPRLDRPETERLRPIDGQPPDPLRVPPGCPFEPRCRFATEQCRAERPAPRVIGDGHRIACWVDV